MRKTNFAVKSNFCHETCTLTAKTNALFKLDRLLERGRPARTCEEELKLERERY